MLTQSVIDIDWMIQHRTYVSVKNRIVTKFEISKIKIYLTDIIKLFLCLRRLLFSTSLGFDS